MTTITIPATSVKEPGFEDNPTFPITVELLLDRVPGAIYISGGNPEKWHTDAVYLFPDQVQPLIDALITLKGMTP